MNKKYSLMTAEEWDEWNLVQCNPAIGNAILKQHTRGPKSYADLKTNYKFNNAPESMTTMEKNIGTYAYKPETINVLNENTKSFGITKNILRETPLPLLNREAKEAFDAKAKGALDSMITHGEVRAIWTDRMNFYRSIGRKDIAMKMRTAMENINAGVRGRPTTDRELRKRSMIIEMLQNDEDIGGMSADDIYKEVLGKRKDKLDNLEGSDKYKAQLSIEKKKLVEQMRIRQIDKESDPEKIGVELEKLAREKGDVQRAIEAEANRERYEVGGDDIDDEFLGGDLDDGVEQDQKEFEKEERAIRERDEEFLDAQRKKAELEARFEGAVPHTHGYAHYGDIKRAIKIQRDARKEYGSWNQQDVKEYLDENDKDKWGRPMVYSTYKGKIVHQYRLGGDESGAQGKRILDAYNRGDKSPFEKFGYEEDPYGKDWIRDLEASEKHQREVHGDLEDDFEGQAESDVGIQESEALDEESRRANEGRRLAQRAHDELTSERDQNAGDFDPYFDQRHTADKEGWMGQTNRHDSAWYRRDLDDPRNIGVIKEKGEQRINIEQPRGGLPDVIPQSDDRP
jgi:hypothetical protein